MEELKEKIRELSLEELEQLKLFISNLIDEKKELLKEKEEYEFYFEATEDPRKGIPFVAKLILDENGKLTRKFYDLTKTYGKKSVTVFGTFRAKEGDVIEMRESASWKNDYRYWYLVYNGKLVRLTSVSNSERKKEVICYLRGEISKEELLENLS